MPHQDLYAVLGLPKSASAQEIKKVYHKLARDYHPDRNPGDLKSEARFKEIAAAFDILGNQEKRALYDEFGPDGLREGFNAEAARQWGVGAGFGGGQAGGFGGNFEDILNQFFGGGGQGRRGGFGGGGFGGPPKRGADIEVQLKITLETAIEGGKETLSKHNIEVKIPKGVYTGQKLRLRGKGQPGRGGPGDLTVKILVDPPDLFTQEGREGRDLRYELPLKLSQVTLGDKVSVLLPDGGRLTLKIPPGLEAQKRMRIPKRGMTYKGGRGHLYIIPVIRTPQLSSTSNDEERARFTTLVNSLDAYYD
jgi:DnaJ-class molecular chaperone